jgi:thymidylate synthase
MTSHINKTWVDICGRILKYGPLITCRGMETRELIGMQSVVDMSHCVLSMLSRNLGYRFMCAEAWWILSGDNRVETIAPYARKIAEFSDDGQTFFGAYGPKIKDQLHTVLSTLEQDITSRQAVISIWRENPPKSRDIPCTVSTQFLIRDNVLYVNHTMRSSDVWLGYPYDVFNFSMLAAYVALHLRMRGFSNLRLGSMIFTAGSQHVYRHTEQKLRETLYKRKAFNYKPLNLNEFKHPEELVAHLALLKDREFLKTEHSWLEELEGLEAK